MGVIALGYPGGGGNQKSDLPLISVIVPIYNVERYVRRCLESLAHQSMKQIEVICLDDGSTDRSGDIAEEYVNDRWPLFRCIHTENRGLSVARNTAIEDVRAEYIMFVDSDDWVELDFCRVPYETAIENNADMVIFQNYNVTEQGRVKKKERAVQTGFLDHETAVDVCGPAWNKIYRKTLFDDIRYPEGHVYEDVATTHKLIYKADRIISISDKLYYYRYRKGSICHAISSEADRFEMSKRRYDDLIKLGYPIEKAEAQLFGAALKCCGRAEMTDEAYQEASAFLNKMSTSSEMIVKDKLMFRLWKINKRLYRVLYSGYIRLCRDKA